MNDNFKYFSYIADATTLHDYHNILLLFIVDVDDDLLPLPGVNPIPVNQIPVSHLKRINAALDNQVKAINLRVLLVDVADNVIMIAVFLRILVLSLGNCPLNVITHLFY